MTIAKVSACERCDEGGDGAAIIDTTRWKGNNKLSSEGYADDGTMNAAAQIEELRRKMQYSHYFSKNWRILTVYTLGIVL